MREAARPYSEQMDATSGPGPRPRDDAAADDGRARHVSAPHDPVGAAPHADALDLSLLPPPGEVLDALTGALALWLPAQRWYAHKGAGTPQVGIAGWAPLRLAAAQLTLEVVLAVRLPDGTETLYQVPLALRRAEAERSAADVADEAEPISVVDAPGGPLCAVDALRTTEGRAALLAPLLAGEGAAGPGLGLSSYLLAAAPPSAPAPPSTPAGIPRTRLLDGEQSNTSMILEVEGGAPLIVKLFRVLQDGENPDVVLQGALTAAGSTRVPAMVGAARLAVAGIRTHALCAQEFLPGVEDAWRVSLREATAGGDPAAAMEALGATVAEVHRDLAAALGTVAAGPEEVARRVAAMRTRLAETAALVPQVAAQRDALEELLAAAGDVPWPALQRVHGDLHLGQVLASPQRGWVLLDFEGEPLRPLAERTLPDCPLRDLAGLLRSLDYAAGAVRLQHGADAEAWAARARAALHAGYTAAAGGDGREQEVLLAAFEADKAVYEALYEARNRPDWLPIPLAALARITSPGAAAGSGG